MTQDYQKQYEHRKHRMLNRHKRGRKKLPVWKKIIRKLLPVVLVISIIMGGLFVLDFFNIL